VARVRAGAPKGPSALGSLGEQAGAGDYLVLIVVHLWHLLGVTFLLVQSSDGAARWIGRSGTYDIDAMVDAFMIMIIG
jgi:hypothetical protein